MLGNFVADIKQLNTYVKNNPSKIVFDEKQNAILITAENPLNKSKIIEIARLPPKIST